MTQEFGLSDKEKNLLNLLANTESVAKTAKALGTTEQAIYQKLHRLRLKRYHCRCVVNQLIAYGSKNAWLGVLLTPMVRLERKEMEGDGLDE